MTLTSDNSEKKKSDAERPVLRVALLADNCTLMQYGPVLRRLSVGLFDEVASLTIVCKGRSDALNFVPSPPVSIISDITSSNEITATKSVKDLTTTLYTPRLNIVEMLNSKHRLSRLASELTSRNITLIHSMGERMEKLAAELAKAMRIPYVTSFLSENHSSLNLRESHCGHIIPCYSHVARILRKNYPDLAEKIHLVEIGTHVSDSTSCYDFGDRWAQIYCCCELEKNMGVPELLFAAKILKDSGRKFQLMICGNGKMEFEFRRQAINLGLSETVHFIEPINLIVNDNDAFRKVFRLSDIFVQCRPSRNWHPELLEAMSAGNAVVAVGESEHSVLIHETTALLCRKHDPNDLAEKIGKLIDDRRYARELAIKCQKYIKKHFLASEMVEKLIRIYKTTLGIL